MLYTFFKKKCAFVDSCIFSYTNANLVEQKLFQKLYAVITNTFCIILILKVVHFQGNHNSHHYMHWILSAHLK